MTPEQLADLIINKRQTASASDLAQLVAPDGVDITAIVSHYRDGFDLRLADAIEDGLPHFFQRASHLLFEQWLDDFRHQCMSLRADITQLVWQFAGWWEEMAESMPTGSIDDGQLLQLRFWLKFDLTCMQIIHQKMPADFYARTDKTWAMTLAQNPGLALAFALPCSILAVAPGIQAADMPGWLQGHEPVEQVLVYRKGYHLLGLAAPAWQIDIIQMLENGHSLAAALAVFDQNDSFGQEQGIPQLMAWLVNSGLVRGIKN